MHTEFYKQEENLKIYFRTFFLIQNEPEAQESGYFDLLWHSALPDILKV